MAPFTFVVSLCQQPTPGCQVPETDDAYASAAALALLYRVPLNALKKRLERWRRRRALGSDFLEVENAARYTPRFLYDRERVHHLCAALQRVVSTRKQA
ncbi:MAG TPA: hypothetical protein VGY58_15630 [Gemmataceae bacterium]|jgi:hypothetical protein|nr:hypothetical protein [Gemmataceae bacterium]